MALEAMIEPEELQEFKEGYEELLEAFHNTVLTYGYNICITHLSRIDDHYINMHIYYNLADGQPVQMEIMGIIDKRYKHALVIIGQSLWRAIQTADRDEDSFLSRLAYPLHYSEKQTMQG